MGIYSDFTTFITLIYSMCIRLMLIGHLWLLDVMLSEDKECLNNLMVGHLQGVYINCHK